MFLPGSYAKERTEVDIVCGEKAIHAFRGWLFATVAYAVLKESLFEVLFDSSYADDLKRIASSLCFCAYLELAAFYFIFPTVSRSAFFKVDIAPTYTWLIPNWLCPGLFTNRSRKFHVVNATPLSESAANELRKRLLIQLLFFLMWILIDVVVFKITSHALSNWKNGIVKIEKAVALPDLITGMLEYLLFCSSKYIQMKQMESIYVDFAWKRGRIVKFCGANGEIRLLRLNAELDRSTEEAIWHHQCEMQKTMFLKLLLFAASRSYVCKD